MCLDTCKCMHIDKFTDVFVDMGMDMLIDMCMDMHTGMFMDICRYMCIEVHIDWVYKFDADACPCA